eukprot:COSAG01_NODE_4131_length_5322_cov_26.056672_1_plen_192_part_00
MYPESARRKVAPGTSLEVVSAHPLLTMGQTCLGTLVKTRKNKPRSLGVSPSSRDRPVESSQTFTTNIYARGRPSPTASIAATPDWSNLALASKADSSTPSPSQHLRSCAAASCRVGFGGGLGHTQARLSGSSPPLALDGRLQEAKGVEGEAARRCWGGRGGAVGRLDAYLSLRSRSTCPGFLCLRFSCTCW